jgi:carbamoyl-phosphate synthase large subunit
VKVYCFDLDETLCITSKLSYELSTPNKDRIRKVNQLFDLGNYIKIFTARGSVTKIDWREITENQLSDWGVKYHELILGKPAADYYIDDKAINVIDFDWSL